MKEMPTPEEIIASFRDATFELAVSSTPVTSDMPTGMLWGKPTIFPFDPRAPLADVSDSQWMAHLEWADVDEDNLQVSDTCFLFLAHLIAP